MLVKEATSIIICTIGTKHNKTQQSLKSVPNFRDVLYEFTNRLHVSLIVISGVWNMCVLLSPYR